MKMHSIESEICYRTIKYTVCRRVSVDLSARKVYRPGQWRNLKERRCEGSKSTGDAVCAKSNARITGSNGETVLINVFEKPFVLVRQMKYNSSLAISSSSSSGSGSRSSSSSVC